MQIFANNLLILGAGGGPLAGARALRAVAVPRRPGRGRHDPHAGRPEAAVPGPGGEERIPHISARDP